MELLVGALFVYVIYKTFGDNGRRRISRKEAREIMFKEQTK